MQRMPHATLAAAVDDDAAAVGRVGVRVVARLARVVG